VINTSENKRIVEIHGCMVCSKLFNILAVYTAEGILLDSIVTSPGGHIVPDERHPLVACDVHTAMEIETYKIWKSKNNES
jgi:hypothetical protein